MQSNRNYERQADFFYHNSSQAFLATLTYGERVRFFILFHEIMGHFEGTARLFCFATMVFSLHLITRSQKSTKMDEFELSGCTKLRYLHDWCCLALFLWFCLYLVLYLSFSLFCNFCFVYIFLKSVFQMFAYCLLLVFFFGRSSLIGTHTPHGLRCLNFCTALCLHNEDDIYSVNECGFFVCLFTYVGCWFLLLLHLHVSFVNCWRKT